MIKESLKKNLISTNQANISQQLKIIVLSCLVTVIPVALIFIFFKLITKLSLDLLTRDPLVITNARFYIGMISNIGILLWCACASTCLFSSAILKKYTRSREISKFLLFSGLLTSLLMLDDLFMIHEVVFPEYLRINEYFVYAIYLGIVVTFLVKNIRIIKRTEFLILLAATVFFGLSIMSDTIMSEIHIVIEDVFKILGITIWFIYFLRLCLQEVSSAIRLSSSSEFF